MRRLLGLSPADAATVLQGLLAGASIPLGVAGYYYEAVRLLFLSYAIDVLDGWLARRFGSSPDGFLLDRAFDRLSQVIAPITIMLLWLKSIGALTPASLALLTIYFSGIVTVSLWRLVKRGVRSLAYFSGLPLFAHAMVAVTSVISGIPPEPPLLLALLLASAVPVPYFRRASGQGSPSPAPWPRLAILLALAAAPYDSGLVKDLAVIVFWSIIAYAIAGPLPALIGVAPSPWNEKRGGAGGGAAGPRS